MRESKNIQLKQLMVHLLNHRENNLVISQRETPFANKLELTKYFIKHITNSLGDPAARAARFVRIAKGITSGICDDLLKGRVDIVEGSKSLAEGLYEVMKSNPVITPGDLIVCRYQATVGDQDRDFLGLLKLDPSEVFRPTEVVDKGQKYIDFELEDDAMPSTRERLQKCVFVRVLEPRSEYDMLLLDPQGRSSGDRVAKFFVETFLGAEWSFDDRARTEEFYRSVITASNIIQDKLTPEKQDKLHQAIDVAMHSDSVSVDNFVDGLKVSKTQKKLIKEKISEKLPDKEFTIDEAAAQRLTKTSRYVGDFGLRVQVRADMQNQVIKGAERVQNPGEKPFYRVTIETESWEKVS
jgi:nucleoid-associated protein YejK